MIIESGKARVVEHDYDLTYSLLYSNVVYYKLTGFPGVP